MVAQTGETVCLDRKLKEVYAGKWARRAERGSRWQEDTSVLSPRRISLSDLAERLFAHQPPPAEYARVVRWIVMIASLPMGEGETVGLSFPLHELFDEDSIDWDRWHELRDIREERALTRDEETEYEWFARIVSRLDAEEEAIAARAVEALVKKHERVIASLERLTEAVKAAAERA